MRNSDIVFLQQNGIQLATAHDITPAHSYKFFKLRKAVDKAFNDIVEKERELLKECNIEQDKQPKEEDAKKFIGLKAALMEDDTPLEGIKAVPYDVWAALQKENKAKEIPNSDKTIDILSGRTEMILEDIFWKAPEEVEEPITVEL